MVARAISIGPNNFQNLVEMDRSFVDAVSSMSHGVIFRSGATLSACTDLQVTPGTGHTANVNVGRAVIREKTNPIVRGAYFFMEDAIENIALPVPTTNPFIATVIARVTDTQYGTVTGAVGARIDVLSGTPASSPVPVSDAAIDAVTNTPGGWIRLCDIRINTADTGAVPVGQFTDVRTAGGFGQMNAYSNARPAAPFIGMKILEIDTGFERQWTGTKWRWIGGKLQIGLFPVAAMTLAIAAATNLVLGGKDAVRSYDPAGIFTRHADTKGIIAAPAGAYMISFHENFNQNNPSYTSYVDGYGSSVNFGGNTSPAGATEKVSRPVPVAANQVFRPWIYLYSGTVQVNGNGHLCLTLMSEDM